ncbi:MAG: 3-phosphoshikimate 1-carboxyvinyltransferase [Gaiellales bacterium]
MSSIHVAPANSVQGEVHLPGDKSVSHRALLMALASTRRVRIENLAIGDDVYSTLAAIEQLGAQIERTPGDPTTLAVRGVGLRGIEPPIDGSPIDCGNAGTLVRLLTGLLAAQPSGRSFELIGDESLSRRPMSRISEPLAELGAQIQTTAAGTMPLRVTSGGPLHGGEIELEHASAQVQGALLLAGLTAERSTKVTEPSVMRDHTERMLRRAGVRITRKGRTVTMHPTDKFELPDTRIPADPSAAAPLIAVASVLHGSLLRLPNLIDSEGRRGFIDVLDQMGGRVTTLARRDMDGEEVADIEVKHATISRTFLETSDVARMIDELPVLALVAHFRRGEFVVRGASELRTKESDRIEDLAQALKRVGISCQVLKDGFIIRGSSVRPDGGTMDAAGDHRLAMLGGAIGLVSRHGVTIENADCVDVSFPGYFDVLEAIAVR